MGPCVYDRLICCVCALMPTFLFFFFSLHRHLLCIVSPRIHLYVSTTHLYTSARLVYHTLHQITTTQRPIEEQPVGGYEGFKGVRIVGRLMSKVK
ncbi:hypothetical protein AG1IA_04100 [Rhizoctonia solani AG-1 IA]|uniref:Uncharacterized protein n=1 Tax=Thanatephorus cucumeris (strain AG1-IA) TaxID=983506 RepID=L8WV54_THACA|nr:hypothetical protein AG1IA_04100 [Rhizoctonia solani AG-1 IA]